MRKKYYIFSIGVDEDLRPEPRSALGKLEGYDSLEEAEAAARSLPHVPLGYVILSSMCVVLPAKSFKSYMLNHDSYVHIEGTKPDDITTRESSTIFTD